ncbi:MAG: transcriptional repressor [Christensenellaceae bacterium]|jgi:Fur family peroxide stress response transcriptional regulator|nr:transcriptional repressor [Christensenellaceae bacterium]
MIYSKQRELVLDALCKAGQMHPTADMLYADIRAAFPTISLATVYRNLNQFADAGQIARVRIPGCADRFDAVNDGHQHMLCTECGKVVDIPASALPDICGAAQSATHLHIDSCKLMLYGRCEGCE